MRRAYVKLDEFGRVDAGNVGSIPSLRAALKNPASRRRIPPIIVDGYHRAEAAQLEFKNGLLPVVFYEAP